MLTGVLLTAAISGGMMPVIEPTCGKEAIGLTKSEVVEKYGNPKKEGILETSVTSKSSESGMGLTGTMIFKNETYIFDGFVLQFSNNGKVVEATCVHYN